MNGQLSILMEIAGSVTVKRSILMEIEGTVTGQLCILMEIEGSHDWSTIYSIEL